MLEENEGGVKFRSTAGAIDAGEFCAEAADLDELLF